MCTKEKHSNNGNFDSKTMFTVILCYDQGTIFVPTEYYFIGSWGGFTSLSKAEEGEVESAILPLSLAGISGPPLSMSPGSHSYQCLGIKDGPSTATMLRNHRRAFRGTGSDCHTPESS